METPQKPQPIPPPPGVVNAIKAGMDIISTHLSSLLLPLALDSLLWFGPRLSVKAIMTSIFDQVVALNAQNNLPVTDLLANKDKFIEKLSQFNLFSILRTFPIGISSLMSGKLPVANPLGAQSVIEIGSEGSLLGWLFLLTLIGWILGGLYFNWVSSVTGSRDTRFGSGRAVAQTLLFSLIITMITFLVGMPAMLVLSVIGLISPGILQAAMFVLALFSAWLIVPIFFAPHGMYLRGQNAFYSIYTSLRMARFTMPTSSMFVLAVFIISQGLNYLWAVPADYSWMTLVGIGGHAFVTTALLAASFIYYRDMNTWLEIVFERLKPNTAAPQT
jgi:hypothetical protein